MEITKNFAFIATSISFGIVWLLKILLDRSISASIAHEFEVKGAVLNSELAQMELRLKDSLAKNSLDIRDVRSGAMAALSQRQAGYVDRNLKSVDLIWDAVSSLYASRNIAERMARIDLKGASEDAKNNALFRVELESLGKQYNVEKIITAASAQPFVTPQLWTYYLMYATLCGQGVLAWNMTKRGNYDASLIKSEPLLKELYDVFPQYSLYIELLGTKSMAMMLHHIEDHIVSEIRKAFAVDIYGDESLEPAASLVMQTEQALQNVRETRLPLLEEHELELPDQPSP